MDSWYHIRNQKSICYLYHFSCNKFNCCDCIRVNKAGYRFQPFCKVPAQFIIYANNIKK